MEMMIATATDVGRKRPNNEDAFQVRAEKGILIVADGMGGHLAGEVASRLAVEVIGEYLSPLMGPMTLEHLAESVRLANRTIYRRSHQDPSLDHMGTTVVVAGIRKQSLLLAHVGDSRAYLLGRSGLELMTEDHTLVFQWWKQGRISREEARNHPQRSGLLQALGMEPEVDVDLREEPYQGESLLLCTDGLTDMLRDREIENILRMDLPPQQICDLLICKANEAGGRDNVTVVLARAKNHQSTGSDPSGFSER